MGVDSQAALEALFAQIDLNSDGMFDYNEICRHFVHDSDWLCAGEQIQVLKEIILPDFKSYTPFDWFWAEFDENHMNSDETEV